MVAVLVVPLFAHGGVGGAVVEVAGALLIVAVGLAVWVGGRRSQSREEP